MSAHAQYNLNKMFKSDLVHVHPYCADGEPGDCVRLLPDGPHPPRGETVYSQHMQEDQEGWMQCSAYSEIYSQVHVYVHACICV